MEIKKIEKIDPEMEVEALAGTGEWYYGMHMWVTMDDVLEALHSGEELEGTRLYLIHYPCLLYTSIPPKESWRQRCIMPVCMSRWKRQ